MCRRRPLLSTGVEIGDVTNYSRIQIQRIEYAEDVKGARVETGDIVTRWASTVTVDHMDRCAVFTSAGELSWVSPERSEEHTSELQSLMRLSYAVFCLTN